MPLLVRDQRSPEWHAARANRITASIAAACLGMDPFKAPMGAWKTITGQSKFDGNKHTAWGVEFEGEARQAYEIASGELATETGFWLHESQSWLGASPDGLCGDAGGCEIKCPSKLPESIPAHHEIQMRVCMAVCDRQWWDYFAWSQAGHFLQRLPRDVAFEQWLLTKLAAWYDAYVLPKICPPRRKRVKSSEPIPLEG